MAVRSVRIAIDNKLTGTWATGTMLWAVPHPLRGSATKTLHGAANKPITLAGAPVIVDLPVTDDPAESPADWAYTVTIDTDVLRGTYLVQVPSGSGTVEFVDLLGAVPSAGLETYATLAQLFAHEAAADPHPQYLTAAEADVRYELVPTGTTDLEAWLTTWAAGIDSDQSYREPTAGEAVDAVLGIERLALGADAAALLGPLGATVSSGVDSATGRPYALAVWPTTGDRTWGAVLVDRSRPIGLTIQCPHPVADQHSETIGLALWQAVQGALLVIAGAHRDATGQQQGGYPLADPGKQVASTFHQIVAAYTTRGVPGVQLHGFADASAPGLSHIVATGSGNAGQSARRAAEELADVAFAAGVARGWDSSGSGTGLTGLTNVQGDQAHAIGVPWLHLEVSATVRGDATARARTVAALAAARLDLPAPPMLALPVTGQFPRPVGSSNTTGSSPFPARADHIHAERASTLARIDVLEQRAAPPHGLAGVSVDALQATSNTGSGVTFTAGVLHLVRVPVPAAATVSTVYLGVTTAGSGLTAGACWAGLYNTVGALLAQTADQATVWVTSGLKPMALTAPADLAAGVYYVAVLVNGSVLPQLARSAIAVAGTLTAGVSTGAHRQMTSGTGQTSLPASVVMASAASTSWVLWTAVS
ncbi:hypothetical protein [Saccharothrix sp. HUAS TT1]|uniref:hypothetical protein n=1 Tax=unclassified Saccharothrix TaxID=2593673 RepID=UPI00345BE19A